MNRWTIEVCDGPLPSREGYVFDQQFHLCRDCTKVALDQLSVVTSNETWPGDEIRERTREVE